MTNSNIPVPGLPAAIGITRAASLSELTGRGMFNHYVIIAGHEGDTFVILERVMGLRAISAERLMRYLSAFGNAAIVFSAPPAPA